MHSTSIIKDLDELGRVVIPSELRKKLGIKTFEIFLDDDYEDRLILKIVDVEYCTLCHNKNNLVKLDENRICNKCIERIKKL